MNNLVKNFLRGGVLMLAAVFAFAFTQSTNDVNLQKFAIVNGVPINITGQEIELDYECDEQLESLCTYEELNGVRVPDSEVPGIYVSN